MKNLKPILFSVYFGIGLLYALYSSFFGAYKYKGFAYNLGRGIIWPATMFPSVGQFIGAVLIIGFVAWITLKK